MKSIKIIYWIITVLFAGFMVFSSIPDLLNTEDAKKFMNGILGYPNYITPFLGVAKILGVIAILIPGHFRIKEWAYAGLFFDLAGALYSIIATKPDAFGVVFMSVVIIFLLLSYFLYHRVYDNKAV